MRILHLTPDFNYSDGRSYYVYLLSKYLQRSGHKVFLCTNAGDSFCRLDDLRIPYTKFPSLTKKSSLLKSRNFISDFIDEHQIDIVHTHHRYLEYVVNSAHSLKKIKTVFTALSIVDRRYFVEYKSDSIIGVSNSVKNMLTDKFGVDEKKISLIPNFVDTEEIQETKKPSDELTENSIPDQVRLLSVGRFHKEKNFETLLRAMASLKDINLKLTLVGDGNQKDRYVQIVKKEKINVSFKAPQRYLKEFFESADICILTSLRDPLPGFMLQAGLYSKPFIGSRVDGIAEVIENNVNGLLFDFGNINELADRIRLFANNKKVMENCAVNLNNTVCNNFTEKIVIPKIENLYNTLLI